MHAQAVHLPAGADLRRSLEQLAEHRGQTGFVLSVVGNLRQACFACPGRDEPTRLSGELEIITLQGTIAPSGVHLHLSLADAGCQVWGGHLEVGSVVLKGADLLVGFLEAADQDSSAAVQRGLQPRLALAVANGCPWSSRALRLLRSHGIPVQIVAGDAALQIPQLFLDGQPIGGYRTLINLLTSGGLEQFRDG